MLADSTHYALQYTHVYNVNKTSFTKLIHERSNLLYFYY